MTPETCRWCRADTYRLGRCPRCGEPAEAQGRWRPPPVETTDLVVVDVRIVPAEWRRFALGDGLRMLCERSGDPVLAAQAAQELLVSVADAPDDFTRERACAWAERADPAFGWAARAFAWGLRQSEAAHAART